jgi:hypothetical protein
VLTSCKIGGYTPVVWCVPADLPGHGPESNSGHTGTISIAVLVLRASWNAMKPGIQCVLAR